MYSFLRYADRLNAYWTGYFTSRPGLKGYVRVMSGYYLVGYGTNFIFFDKKIVLCYFTLGKIPKFCTEWIPIHDRLQGNWSFSEGGVKKDPLLTVWVMLWQLLSIMMLLAELQSSMWLMIMQNGSL